MQQASLSDVGEPLSTQAYLRKSIDDFIDGLPLLAVGEVKRNQFELKGGVYATKPTVEVVLHRVMALFDMQTLPFPQGYSFKRISLERVPGKFCVKGDLGKKSYEELNAENPTDYPYFSMQLWGSTPDAPSHFIGFKKASYESNKNGDRVLDGTFFMPPVKAHLTKEGNKTIDPFGKSTNAGMPFLRFVFTDPKGNTLVRLFRLGNSDTAEDKMGNIDRNARYKIRIHLLGRSVVRDESLKSYDEGALEGLKALEGLEKLESLESLELLEALEKLESLESLEKLELLESLELLAPLNPCFVLFLQGGESK